MCVCVCVCEKEREGGKKGRVGGQRHAPDAALPLGMRPGIHCTGDWVDPRASLDGWGKSCPHRDAIYETHNP